MIEKIIRRGAFLITALSLLSCTPEQKPDAVWSCQNGSFTFPIFYQDSGIVLSTDQMTKIFEPFCQIALEKPLTIPVKFDTQFKIRLRNDGLEPLFGETFVETDYDSNCPTGALFTKPAKIHIYTDNINFELYEAQKSNSQVELSCSSTANPCTIKVSDFPTLVGLTTYHEITGHALSFSPCQIKTWDTEKYQAEETRAHEITTEYFHALKQNPSNSLLDCSKMNCNPQIR